MSRDDPLVEDRESIFDSIERGIGTIRETQATQRVESDETDQFGFSKAPTLEDVGGVGPATADKLRAAGIDKPEELSRTTPNELELIDGIGPKRADKIADTFNFSSDIRFNKKTDVPEEVRKKQADRSKDARRTDRSFNATPTFDEEEWLDDPNQFDFPGVDTIPEQRRAERAADAAERTGVSSIDSANLPGQTQGRQAGGSIEVDTTSVDPVSTLAHEVGHAIEPERGFAESEIFDDSEELRNEAAKLSARRRFTAGKDDPEFIRERISQDEDSELFADAVGVAIEEPRAARREAPNIVSEIEQEFPSLLPGKRG
jgi:hypothetical protein